MLDRGEQAAAGGQHEADDGHRAQLLAHADGDRRGEGAVQTGQDDDERQLADAQGQEEGPRRQRVQQAAERGETEVAELAAVEREAVDEEGGEPEQRPGP